MLHRDLPSWNVLSLPGVLFEGNPSSLSKILHLHLDQRA